MKHKNKKKSLLAVATSLAPTGIVLLTKGQPVTGGILIAMSVLLMLAYDHYDDKAKGTPKLPEGVDEELLTSLAYVSADTVKQLTEQYNSGQSTVESAEEGEK